MKKYSLYIDTADAKSVTVRLNENQKLLSEKSSDRKYSSQILLPLIIDLLYENNISVRDISSVEINRGPGSYTGLKVGASVANALGYYLKIPVNGSDGGFIDPVYR